MLIKFNPKVEHLKCVVLTPKEGLNLTRTMVHLLPGTNEVTDDEWKAMRGNINVELENGEIVALAQKVGDGRGKPGGRKARNLKDMPVNIAVKYVSECNNPETLEKWYKEVTKEEVRLAITKRMKALEVEEPTDEIPDAPNASPVSLDELDDFDDDENEEETEEDGDGDDEDDEDSDGSEEVDFSSMTVKQLKKECKDRGIDCDGFKQKEDYISALTEGNNPADEE